MDDLLTVKQVAELKGCSERYIQGQIKSGDIYAQEHDNPANNRKQYMIPVSSLPQELQRKYYAKLKGDGLLPAMPKTRPERPSRSFDEYSAAEREKIAFWTRTLQEWQAFRDQYDRKVKGDSDFVTLFRINNVNIPMSTDILYRKWAAYKNGDIDGLLDHRGGWNRGKCGIHTQIWEAFLYYYLDDCRLPVSQCYQITQEWAKDFYPEWVETMESERTFRRRLDTIPKAVVKLMRYGEKACYDECLPYIERLYNGLEANDVWIADNHTFDIMSQRDGEKTVHRMYITGFLDAKSGVLAGWNVTDNPCSQSTIFGLRHGFERFGIPKVILFDNGTEFLCYDIAGRGHRSRKSTSMIEHPPAILTRLGIEMKNAQVRNARAKPIERFFLTFKNTISRLFDTYTGGNILEKPESLKDTLKSGKIPTDSKLREYVAELIDGIYNMGQYGGSEAKFDGMTRLDVWNESIQNRELRKATESDLNLMLMRTNGYQKIARKGVCLNESGAKLWYADKDTWLHFGKEVYVRYNPEDLSTVRVYDKEDRYMFTLPMDEELRCGFLEPDKDKLANANERLRHQKKAVKDYAKGLIANLTAEQRIDALDIRIRQAHAAKEGMVIREPKRVTPIMANEVSAGILQEAVGQGSTGVVIDMAKMNKNAAKRRSK